MPQRILVGFDHSEEAAAGLRRAVTMANADRAELTIVHVAVPPPSWVGVGMLAVPLVDDVVTSGCDLVRRAVEELPDDLAVRWHLVSGPEASAGLSRARCVRRALGCAMRRGCHDTLVLGTGPRPGRVARGLLRDFPGHVVLARYVEQPTAAPAAPAAPMVPSVSLK